MQLLRTFPIFVALLFAACSSRDAHIPLPERDHLGRPAGHDESPAERRFWSSIRDAEIIYLGEIHDRDDHHQFQFDVLRGMHDRGLDFAVGWEMFEWPQQDWINAWEAGALPLDNLFEKVDWQARWGVLSDAYETMLRWTRSAGISNIALNAPAYLTRKIARGRPLDEADQRMLPEGFYLPKDGLARFRSQMTGHPGLTEENLTRYYQAQLLWETTMADRIIEFYEGHPGTRLVVLIGRGHVGEHYGVPFFVRQKISPRQLILDPGAPLAGRGSRLVEARPSFPDPGAPASLSPLMLEGHAHTP